MVKVKNSLVGQKFGRLTVLYQTDDYVSHNGKHYAQYHCKCDCDKNNELDVRADGLINNRTLSCGCLKKERAFEYHKKFNLYEIKDDIVYIKLSNCDDLTILNIDKWNDIPLIRNIYWYKDDCGYAVGNISNHYDNPYNKSRIRLHQLICPCKDGFVIDHIDRNKLNNLTKNLRQATYSENNLNKDMIGKKVPTNNTSGVIGVRWDKKSHKWSAQITVNHKRLYLGYFENFDDAVKARKEAEMIYFS